MTNKIIDAVALTLGIVGALNWGLIGLFKFDLVATLFGNMSILSRIVYALVGFAGIYLISFFRQLQNACFQNPPFKQALAITQDGS